MTQPIFISYAHTDKETVSHIIAALQAADISVWIDHQKLTPGTTNWEHSIRTAIAKAPAFILIASPNAVQSLYVPDELSIARLREPQIPIIPVWIAGKDIIHAVPLGMGRVQAVDLRDTAFDTNIKKLIATLHEIVGAGKPPPLPLEKLPRDFVPRNPYQGLEAFTEKTSRYYFGRRSLVNTLAQRLQKEPFLAVVGASGSGKSSVVMAGLLPRLREEHPEWVILPPMKPGARPVEELAIILAAQRQTALTSVKPDLTSANTRGLHVQSKMIARDSRAVLVVDQFEELFTLTADEATRKEFINLLTTAVSEPDGNLTVILTLRADFSDRPLAYPELGRLISEHNEPVLPMSLAEWTEVVLGPTALDDVRLIFESDLASRLVYSVREQPGGLPLLQFALDQLFQRREGQLLTLKAYSDIGELKGALAQHADATYAALPSDLHRQVARGLFLRLTSPGATEQDITRRRLMQHELTPADPEQRQVLDEVIPIFINARLLTTGELTLEATLEVSHEALIREWSTLRRWLDQYRNEMHLQQSIRQDATNWLRNGKRLDDLYLGEKQSEAEAWMRSGAFAVSTRETEFIQAGARRQRELREGDERRLRDLHKARAEAERADARSRRSRSRATAAFVLATLVSLIALILIVVARQSLEVSSREREQVQSQNLALSARQALFAGDTFLAVPLVLAANNVTPVPNEAKLALAEVAYAPGVQRIFEGHSNGVTGIELTADGKRLLSSSCNVDCTQGELILWDVSTKERLRTFVGHSARVNSIAIHPDGTSALSASDDGTLILWNLAATSSSTKVCGLECQSKTLTAHGGGVNAVRFSADGTIAVSGGCGQRKDRFCTQGKLIVWDTSDYSIISTMYDDVNCLEGVTGNCIRAIALNNDGTLALSVSSGSSIFLWDVQTGEQLEVFEFSDQVSNVWDVEFAPDEQCFAAGTDDKLVELIDLTQILDGSAQNAACKAQSLEGHSLPVTTIAFSPSGRSVLSGSTDGNVILWDTQSGRQLAVLRGHTSEKPITDIVFAKDGLSAFSSSEDNTIIQWSIANGSTVAVLEGHSDITWRAVYSDLMANGTFRILSGSIDQKLIVWDGITGEQIRTIYYDSPVESVDISKDGKRGVSASRDGLAIIWDLDTGKSLLRFKQHPFSLNGVAFSPDDKYVFSTSAATATGTVPPTAFLWDAQTGAVVMSFATPPATVWGGTFSPDGKTVASGCDDGTVILWEVDTGQIKQIYHKAKQSEFDALYRVVFTPDGTRMLAGSFDKTITVWEVTSGEILRTVSFNGGVGLDINPVDGRSVLSSGLDGTIVLWDLETGVQERVYSARSIVSNTVSFSPDGRYAVTGSSDPTIAGENLLTIRRIHTYDELLVWTREHRITNRLSCDDKIKYNLQPLC